MAKIYVIDDDEQLLHMVGLMLERGGHAVTTINSPVKGVEQILAEPPDLLVCDVMMPGMSGHDVTRKIRATKKLENLPILILTARSQEIDRTTALKSGADDYMSKPVTSRELIERVDGLLSKGPGEFVPEEGMIIAVYGLRGGVGQTTVAVNLAAALRQTAQQEVCLFDLSPSGSQATSHMRIQTEQSWAEALIVKKLDWVGMKDFLSMHPSGVRVLAAPVAPQLPTVPSAKTTKQILKICKEHTVFTVVDLPSVFNPAFKATLEIADISLHVLSPDVISVQSAIQVNRVLTKSGMTLKQKSYILNQVTPEAQLPTANVERGLGGRVSFHIGYDPNQLRALAQGVPLALTKAKSPIPTVTRRMAEVIWQHIMAQQSA